MLLCLISKPLLAKEVPFTQEDRERLIRLEVTLKEFKDSVDKRFEEYSKQMAQQMTFLYILSGIFTALVVAVIALAIWDRKTFIKRAREEALEVIEREWRVKAHLEALREFGKRNEELGKILKERHLL